MLHVDDILLNSNNIDLIEKCKVEISNKFKCTDLGEINTFLNINVKYDRNKGILTANQHDLIMKIAKKFRVENFRKFETPAEERLVLEKCNDSSLLTKSPYRELVGSFMYIILNTRPDICFSISFFSQDFKHLPHILMYLVHTKDHSFTYKRKVSLESIIEVYSDADWGNCPETHRSFSRGVVFVYGNMTNWHTKKHNSETLSSTETEFVAICNVTTEAMWTRRLLLDLGEKESLSYI